MLASAEDGTGGDEFYRCMRDKDDPAEIYEDIMRRGRNETVSDQWMTQILSRILMRARIIYVSKADPGLVRGYHMTPAATLEEAMRLAEETLGDPNSSVIAIPDGVSVMVQKR